MSGGYRYAGEPSARLGRLAPRALAVVGTAILGFLIGRLGAPAGASTPSGGQPRADGPTRVRDGVPLGYAHSKRGAVVAVANFERALTNPQALDLNTLRRRLSDAGTPAFVGAAIAQNTPGTLRISSGPIGQGIRQGIRTLYSGTPLGYRIEAYSPIRCRILTWGLSLVANGAGVEPRAFFGVTHTELVWQNDDWKIAATSGAFGPTPVMATPHGPSAGYSVLSLASELRSYDVAP